MNCPKCSRKLGCSCQLRYDPTDGHIVGCAGCLQGKSIPNTSTKPVIKTVKPIQPINTPVVNRAYWTGSKK